MLKKNQIVLTKQGLMKVFDSNQDTSIIYNHRGIKKSFITRMIIPLPDSALDEIRKSTILDLVDSWTFKKGRDYYLGSLVSDFDYDLKTNTFSAMIEGNFIYRTTFNFRTNKRSCSCPVNGFCKHQVALILSLIEELKDLDELEIKEEEKAHIDFCLSLLTDNEPCNIGLIEELDKINDDNYEAIFKASFSYKYKERYSYYYNNNLKYILYNERLYPFLNQFFRLHSKEYKEAYQVYNSPKINDYDEIIYLATNKKPRGLDLALECVSLDPDDEFFTFLSYFFSLLEDKKPAIDKILDESEISDALISNLEDYFSYDDLIYYIKAAFKRSKPIQIIPSVAAHFEIYNDIRFMPLLSPNRSLIDYYIKNRFELAQKNPSAFMAFYLKYSRYDKQIANMTFNDLALGGLDVLYDCSIVTHDRKSFKYEEILEGYYDLASHLSYEITPNLIYREINIRGLLYTEEIISLRLYYEGGELMVGLNLFPRTYLSDNRYIIPLKIMGHLKALRKEELDSKLLEFKRALEAEELRTRILKLGNIIDDFALSFDNKEKSLSQTKPLSLSFSFEGLDFYKGGTTNRLRIKIGNDKMYYVKNLGDFKRAFNNNDFKSYGKSLAFYHNTDAFCSEYRKALDYLLRLIDTDTRDRISLNNDDLYELIKLSKGNTIYYLDKPYEVVGENLELSCFLDSDYRFSVNYEPDEVILANNALLIFRDGRINFSSFKRSEAGLIELCLKLHNECLEPIKDKFIKEVYGRIPDKIKISEALNINRLEAKIEAYFDYANDKIIVESKMLENGEEIDPALASYQGRLKYNNYLNYLNTLGFINDELSDLNLIGDFFSMDFSYLREIADVYLSDRINNLDIKAFIKPSIHFEASKDSMMNVFLEDISYPEEELKQILKALKEKKKFLRLNDNQIISFNEEDFNYYLEYKSLGLDKASRVEIPAFNILRYASASSYLVVDDYLKALARDLSGYKSLDIKLPSLNAKLRSYQEEGFRWLSVLEKYHLGGILADEMGLGKTLEVIALLNRSKDEPSLIVMPKSLSYNWLNEIRRFDPTAKAYLIAGNKAERDNIINNIKLKERAYYLVSYDTLRNTENLNNITFNYIILDEAQYIKNFETKKSEAIRSLKGSNRLALTGTPLENNIQDLWSIFLFLMPGFFPGLEEFNSLYRNDIRALRKRIKPFILRRTKKEYLNDLPDKYEDIISAEMTDAQKRIYEAVKLEAKNELVKSDATVFSLFKYLLRLRQASISPALFTDTYLEESGKLSLLRELVIDLVKDNHKIIIFSQFVKALNLIEEILKSQNISYLMITGSTDAKGRIDIVNMYNASNAYRVILISLKAGGTGLNLTSADTVIHLDPWWNAAVENQATDRAHRIGQTKNVRVIKLISEGSVEERVIELQNRKKDLFNDLVSENASGLGKITTDDIKFILG